jgi:hypothetical protein
MKTYELGDGATIDLELTPSLLSASGKAGLRVPDPVFPEIKGTLRPYPDRPMGSTTPTIMSAKAEFTLHASKGDYWIGFKQLARLLGSTELYAGLKDQDGSTIQGSTDINWEWMIDCEFDQVGSRLTAVGLPFYNAKALVRPGRAITIEMQDQPGGGARRLQVRNKSRDRWNFLLTSGANTEFVTFIVVERPDGKHIPVEGFSWKYRRDVGMFWTNGTPSIASDNGGATLQTKFVNIAPGDTRQSLLTSLTLKESDTVVFKMNDAMIKAQRGPTSGFEIKEYDNYAHEISDEFRSRFRNQFT